MGAKRGGGREVRVRERCEDDRKMPFLRSRGESVELTYESRCRRKAVHNAA